MAWSLFDRSSYVQGLAGLAMGLVGFRWWVALLVAIVLQVAEASLRSLSSRHAVPWPNRNHVVVDIALVMVGYLVGIWLHPTVFGN